MRTVWRRCAALALAAAVFWALSVTAGSASAVAAWKSLAEAAPLGALRWELGDRRQEGLSSAAALALAQAPVLLAARQEIVAAEDPPVALEITVSPTAEEEDEIPLTVPKEETPVDIPGAADNGVPAKSLLPSSPEGYTVFGRVYISNATEHPLPAEELGKTFAAELTGENPQVLILHTHGSESYTPVEGTELVWSGDHRTTDARYNVVRAGDAMADALAAAGISVLHDRTLYDYPNYSGAYDRSLAAIETYLTQYPSIHFILDVHRDAIEDGEGNQFKLISSTEAGTAAQLSIVVGSDGSGAEHPEWMENLRLAAAIQEEAAGRHPTLMRPILLRNSRYNQHATTGSLLVEVGAAGNSPEEAVLAAKLFGEAMAEVLTARSK